MKSIFGDLRLDKRLQKLQAAMIEKPCGCLSQICKQWSGLKAGYNFLK
jgi:Transposase DNA-binding